jgi:hypothetical protein
MPKLIEKHFFKKDHRDGLPLREVLRELDSKGMLYLIPQVSGVQNETNTFWFFNISKQ